MIYDLCFRISSLKKRALSNELAKYICKIANCIGPESAIGESSIFQKEIKGKGKLIIE